MAKFKMNSSTILGAALVVGKIVVAILDHKQTANNKAKERGEFKDEILKDVEDKFFNDSSNEMGES